MSFDETPAPDGGRLDPDDPKAVRERLEAERRRLTGLRDSVAEGLSDEPESRSLNELSDNDQHPAEVATETFNRERDLSFVDSVEGELSDVEAALERLDQGTYGRCTACGRPISPERLAALPATAFCVEDAAAASAGTSPGAMPTVGT